MNDWGGSICLASACLAGQLGGPRRVCPWSLAVAETAGYVVRNDETGDIVQVSDLNAPNWKSPW